MNSVSRSHARRYVVASRFRRGLASTLSITRLDSSRDALGCVLSGNLDAMYFLYTGRKAVLRLTPNPIPCSIPPTVSHRNPWVQSATSGVACFRESRLLVGVPPRALVKRLISVVCSTKFLGKFQVASRFQQGIPAAG